MKIEVKGRAVFIKLLVIGFIFGLLINKNIFANEHPIYLKPKEYNFVVYGDNRNNGIIKNKIHRQLLRQIKEHEKDFIINLGDMVLWRGAWKSFFKDIASANIKVSIFPVRGNHDNQRQFKEYFKKEKTYYSINYGIAHLIILDNNKELLDQEQYEWLINDLESHQDYKWLIVLAHKPLYSGANQGVRKELIAQLESLFKEYKVKMFIASHYHNYERLSANDLTHIVSGGGGAPLTGLKKNIPQLIKHETKYHYLLIHISSQEIAVKVYGIKGDVIDEFAIK